LIAFILLFSKTGEANGEEEMLMPQGPSVVGNFTLAFQANSPLIRSNGNREKVHPFYQYLELNAVSPKEGLSFNSYSRGRQVFSGEERSFDAYYAFLEYRNGGGTVDVRLGRQILTEGTNYYLVDGGLVKFRPTQDIEILAYAGYQDRDTHPDPEAPLISSSIYGVKLKSSEFLDSIISLGYERINPQDFGSRDFLHLSLNRLVPFTESADFYTRGEIDVGEGDLALLTTGVGMTPYKSLHLNVEYDVSRPDGDRGDYLQDRIFDLFSVSRLHQAKTGVTYIPAKFLKTSASYAFSRYEVSNGVRAYGHLTRLGFSWDFWRRVGLKAFQGLYYLKGRGKDEAVGVNFSVSEEILRGLNLHYSFAFVHVETLTNKIGDAFSHAFGLQYLLIRNLLLKAEVELNDNPDFQTDTRVNLVASYDFYF